ncbi:alpha/beta fold hydrolase [Enemella evansiae]|uniref:alpha/beta fold hydrolase n=1 Tax=Enemella evansiae TaxID=2016499 RepID=UPI0015953226|nr:alpha/beta fold hydrolase [Enemella evansiae]
MSTADVAKQIVVDVSIDDAFNLFVTDPKQWWPPSHTLQPRSVRRELVIEPFAGGTCYEQDVDGEKVVWGTITSWQPPHQMEMTWRIDGHWRPIADDERSSTIRAEFVEVDTGTQLTLTHAHLDRVGETAPRLYAALEGPSPGETLERFGQVASRPTPVRPFQSSFTDADLQDLKRRLQHTRWPDPAPSDSQWERGVPRPWLQHLLTQWQDTYDWRQTEQRINALPQYLTEIDGLDLHFAHVQSANPNAVPLLLCHGWPGSFLEYLDIARTLAETDEQGRAFHVVCPSLPGFGFSGKPTTPGWTAERMAETYKELMRRLGYDQYFVHGTDWGSFIAAIMGEEGDEVRALHITMPFARPTEDSTPLSDLDYAGLARLKSFQENEGGYSVLQSTRPQTLAYALTDSPVGQLAWMAEKYWAWSDHPHDDLFSVIPADRLLGLATLCWLTATGGSSAHIYWESQNKLALRPVNTPTMVANYPKDGRMPRPWIEGRFSDIRAWEDYPHGGHFPALEQPEQLVGALREFFSTIN